MSGKGGDVGVPALAANVTGIGKEALLCDSSLLGKPVGAFGFAIGDTLPVVTLNCVGNAIVHPYCGAGTSGLGSAVAALGAGTAALFCAALVFGAGVGVFGCAVNAIVMLLLQIALRHPLVLH